MTVDHEASFQNLWLPHVEGNPGGIILEVFIFIYCMMGLAVVCENYLVPSLETLCVRWKIREDVAGATFLAFGNATPEIIISIVGTIKEEGDLGVSVSIGSGMLAFGILPALCVLASGIDQLTCKRRPLARDAFFYLIGLCCLTAFFSDGYVDIYESIGLLAVYFCFLFVVFISPTFRKTFRHYQLKQRYMRRIQEASAQGQNRDELEAIKLEYTNAIAEKKNFVLAQKEAKEKAKLSEKQKIASENGKQRGYGANETGEYVVRQNGIDLTQTESIEVTVTDPPKSPKSDDEADDELLPEDTDLITSATTASHLKPSLLHRLFTTTTKPLSFLMSITCIKCDFESPNAHWYPLTLIVGFAWVSVFAYIISVVAGRWTIMSGAPMTLFGILLVGTGSAIPDNIASVSVAKRGYGSMALSNGVGAQITNMLFGLGLPFTLYNILQITGEIPEIEGRKGVRLYEVQDLLIASSFQLLGVTFYIAILLIVALAYNDSKAVVTRTKGWCFMFMYAFIIIGFCVTTAVLYTEKDYEVDPVTDG